MRGIFTIVGLLVVLAIVGITAKKQLSAGVAPVVPRSTASAPAGTPQQQVQQYKSAVESAMQQPRPMPDDSK
jgi:type II secretory pathway pseudopilin PulG